MATAADLLRALDRLAPFGAAEDWDNVGLIAGSAGWAIGGPVVVTIDLTAAVAREVIALGAGAVVAYHPPIFAAMKRFTDDSGRMGGILELVASRIAIVSPHTALDAATGGVADFLADVVATPGGAEGGGTDRVALAPHNAHRSGGSHKVVTIVPRDEAGAVRSAMADAGAGVLGEYTECAFAIEGVGTFRGSDASTPAVGKRGALESVEEVRIEMVCPGASLAGVVAAIRAAHSYEEPPIEVYPMTPVPDRRIGAGRAVTMEKTIGAAELGARVKKALGVPTIQVATASAAPIARVGVCPGAGGSLVDAAIAAGCTAFVTGEMRHHDVVSALDRGVSVILAGHTETERPYLPRLADRLRAAMPGTAVVVSKVDRSPFAH